MKIVQRKDYLDFLVRWQERQIIKVVSGVRRCGKSTLFDIYKDHLLNNGVSEKQIISINFENVDFEHLKHYKKLHDFVQERLLKDKMNYVFLDEIQHVPEFEKTVDSLYIKDNVDLYITGSNAYFMSGELATLISGRYVELKMLPLSFKEYYEATQGSNNPKTKIALYQDYVKNSSFPYTLRLGDSRQDILEYLQDVYNSIVLKDIVTRNKFPDVMMLESVIKFMADNIGSKLSTNKIANTMTSKGRKIDQKNVEKYVKAVTESLMFYQVNRYDIKGGDLLATLEKYYIVDVGLRYLLLGSKLKDSGHILENIIYLELLRRGYKLYVGQNGNKEVDFIAEKDDDTYYFQVALTVMDEETLKRELESLQKISDNHPKYLLTLDELNNGANYEGIKQINAVDWLLD